ncbi:unnamed protein product [Darwinula stevensoni]|uniref:Insulin-like domain-containing protein n=1 Tax=Darwinula stevensoni TaxID=69355 RepID=A0A7R8XGK1_9CRUS|nr:unnamed protein product [Darwinula stevensoni]CAG0892604.1 unnamed protein product [Darwinula stevensoni]
MFIIAVIVSIETRNPDDSGGRSRTLVRGDPSYSSSVFPFGLRVDPIDRNQTRGSAGEVRSAAGSRVGSRARTDRAQRADRVEGGNGDRQQFTEALMELRHEASIDLSAVRAEKCRLRGYELPSGIEEDDYFTIFFFSPNDVAIEAGGWTNGWRCDEVGGGRMREDIKGDGTLAESTPAAGLHLPTSPFFLSFFHRRPGANGMFYKWQRMNLDALGTLAVLVVACAQATAVIRPHSPFQDVLDIPHPNDVFVQEEKKPVGHHQYVRACGDGLLDLLIRLCEGNVSVAKKNIDSWDRYRWDHLGMGLIPRTGGEGMVKRQDGIVTMCCWHACSVEELMQFCG